MLFRIVALFWLIGAASFALAQVALNNGLPQKESTATAESVIENAWIDLRQHPAANSRPQSAPSWVEAVTMAPTVEINGASAKTVFRIRIAHPPGDYQVLYFRLFFDDNSDARPELVAWDELGTQVLRSGELGSGVGLPTSDSVIIPISGISTLDIEVPGDGKTIRGAYLDWMTSSEDIGAATLTLPELADPGYRGQMESLLKEMRFQYTGWLRAQKLIPVNNLNVGTNDMIILSGSATSTSAIRGTQVQLKYPWEKSDYLLQADH